MIAILELAEIVRDTIPRVMGDVSRRCARIKGNTMRTGCDM